MKELCWARSPIRFWKWWFISLFSCWTHFKKPFGNPDHSPDLQRVPPPELKTLWPAVTDIPWRLKLLQLKSNGKTTGQRKQNCHIPRHKYTKRRHAWPHIHTQIWCRAKPKLGQAADEGSAANSQLCQCIKSLRAKARSASERTGYPGKMKIVEAGVNGFSRKRVEEIKWEAESVENDKKRRGE